MKVLAALCILALLGGTAIELKDRKLNKMINYVLVIENPVTEHECETDVRLQTEHGVVTMPLEEYLVGVVLTEMPASFSEEAMKAQAVAARTFALRIKVSSKHAEADICSQPGCCQAWRSNEELRQVFGENYDMYRRKGQNAVEATAGQVLLYNGKMIEAVYFSCSGGSSEDAVAVWGTEVPYLQSVASPGEEQSVKFSSEVRVSVGEFCKRIKQAYEEAHFSAIPQDWIGETHYTVGGGVAKMEIGGVPISGTKLRSLFGLASTKFTLRFEGGEMVFSVKGNGHRVGMSQYGADAMAAEGANYEEILAHYYTGVSIKKLSRT